MRPSRPPFEAANDTAPIHQETGAPLWKHLGARLSWPPDARSKGDFPGHLQLVGPGRFQPDAGQAPRSRAAEPDWPYMADPAERSPLSPSPEARLPSAFNRLAWSNLAAQSAEQIGLAAAPLVAVLALGAGAGETGCSRLPRRYRSCCSRSRRRPGRPLVAAPTDGRGRGACVLSRCSASWPLRARPAVVAAAGAVRFVGAAGTVAYSVAAPSLVPALVPPRALNVANGRLELARSVAFMAGPALAGGLSAGRRRPTFGFAAALSIWPCCCWRACASRRATSATATSCTRSAKARRSCLAHPLLRPVLLTAVFFNVAFTIMQAVYVPYAVHQLGLSASGVGATLGMFGVGMVRPRCWRRD